MRTRAESVDPCAMPCGWGCGAEDRDARALHQLRAEAEPAVEVATPERAMGKA
jgi:hypothetical protein